MANYAWDNLKAMISWKLLNTKLIFALSKAILVSITWLVLLTTIYSSWDDSSWSIFWLPLNWQTWTRYHSDLKYHIFPTPALSLLKLFCCELEGKDKLMWRIQFTENLVDIMYKLNTINIKRVTLLNFKFT